MPLPLILLAGAAAALGVGAKKAYDGYQSHSEADEIVERATALYNESKSRYDKQESETQGVLAELGNFELKIGKEFEEFSTIADSLLTQFNQSRENKLEITLPKHKLEKIETFKFTATTVLSSIIGGGAAGAAAGFAVYGGVMTFAAASTGTAIASLSGVAATNATLAAIGGGSLTAGGLGMAGGTAILGATVAAPVLAIFAWGYATHGEKALENAHAAKVEADKAIKKLEKATSFFGDTQKYVNKVHLALSGIYSEFHGYLKNLREIDRFISSARNVTHDEEAINRLLQSVDEKTLTYIENGYMLAAILTDIISTPLFKLKQENNSVAKDENGTPVLEKDADDSPVLNALNLEKAIEKAGEESAGIASA
jgi:hypothetical protein